MNGRRTSFLNSKYVREREEKEKDKMLRKCAKFKESLEEAE